MAGASLLALLDDIATLMDDVSVMTKVAARKTAGVLGDDLAVNAEKVTGVAADRELPVVYATSSHSRVDPKLNDIARYLKNLRYTGYELVGTQRAQLAPKGGQTFTIAGNRKVWADRSNICKPGSS